MRKPFIAGNWKLNNTISESIALSKGLVQNLKHISDKNIVICPPFTSLFAVFEVIKDTNIKLGAQNCSFADKGAYTGEVSPKMLIDAGCSYVIIGHSERRQYFAETDEIINKKIQNALNAKIKVIFCIGETLKEREQNKTFSVIESQLKRGLKDINIADLTIAYEPVWAIGTGKTATPDQAEEVHKFIRSQIATLYDKNQAENIHILYGGSVTPENIKGLMQCPNVDGGLVGGASLKIDSFTEIVKLS